MLMPPKHSLDRLLTLMASGARDLMDRIAAQPAEEMRGERIKQFEAATTASKRLDILLEQPPSAERDTGIANAISDASFAMREQHSASTIFRSQRRAPAAVALGLRQRIERRLELPFRPAELLTEIGVDDDGLLAAAVLDIDGAQKDESSLGLLAGPKTVGQLIDRFLRLAVAMRSDPSEKATYEGFHRTKARIGATRPAPFMEAILNRAETDNTVEIYFLADLVAAHGDANNADALIHFPDSQKEAVVARMREWSQTVLASPQATRSDLCEVSNAIGRLGLAELVPEITQLLDEEIVRLRKLTDALARSDRSEINDARMRYGNQYQMAFARIRGEAMAKAVVRYLEEPGVWLRGGAGSQEHFRSCAERTKSRPVPALAVVRWRCRRTRSPRGPDRRRACKQLCRSHFRGH
jgi:hypothetical protein